jgi:histidinol phosphatase-like enzyme (inositol monophosphatase family)
MGVRVEAAVEFLPEVDGVILSHFRHPRLAVEDKADGSPVTIADRETERLLRARIAARFPEDGVLGEEAGETPGRSGFRWVLDPIDGTKSFVRGVPLFGTLIGIEHDEEAAGGIIHLPALGETLHACRGEGAWWRVFGEAPRPARVSACSRLADALCVITGSDHFARRGCGAVYPALLREAGQVRTWGDAYGFALVATGRADLMVDPGLALWDAAPLLPILEEAGGAFTDWTGRATVRGGNGIAGNGRLAEAALDLVRRNAGGPAIAP